MTGPCRHREGDVSWVVLADPEGLSNGVMSPCVHVVHVGGDRPVGAFGLEVQVARRHGGIEDLVGEAVGDDEVEFVGA